MEMEDIMESRSVRKFEKMTHEQGKTFLEEKKTPAIDQAANVPTLDTEIS
jgi:hypothetical protein